MIKLYQTLEQIEDKLKSLKSGLNFIIDEKEKQKQLDMIQELEDDKYYIKNKQKL